ncbi:TPA: hypothetical protein ACH3X2_013571 [Trebouxia sp. C0005]
MIACLQQQSAFCTEAASDVSNSTDSWQHPPSAQPKQVGPIISLLAKELQAQWQKKRNMQLGNRVIRPGSNHKVWWSCDKCPDSLPHVWEAIVNTRSKGTGCPFCSGKAICQHNTLARKAPAVTQFWDAKNHHPLSPGQVTASSNVRAHWKCSVCSHEWQAPVKLKACRNSGCPKCAKASGGRRADGTRQKHPTCAAAKHALLEQWDHDKNRENGSFPDHISLTSGKHIWWRCHACPKGQIHSWQAPPYRRNSGKLKAGCPFCAGQKVCECNALETVCPDIAADFDIEQNGVSPAEVTSSTLTKYSWLSDGPGAQKRSVSSRTLYAKRKSLQLLNASDF